MSDKDTQSQQEEEFKAQPITEAQVDASLNMLKELYPISSTPLTVAYPYLGYVCCCLGTWSPGAIKTKEDLENEQELLIKGKQSVDVNGKEQKFRAAKKQKNNAKVDEEEVKKDPFILLGSGMVAYRSLMYTMIWTFLMFTILSVPAIYSFSSYGGYSQIPVKLQQYEMYSLGNMGYSSTQCGVSQLGNITHQLVMGCPYGTIGELIEFGVNPKGSVATTCMSNSVNSVCNPPQNSSIRQQFQNLGNSTQTISIDISESNVFGLQTPQNECTGFEAWVYVQFTCVQQVDAMVTKYQILSVIATIGLFICLVYIQVIRSLRQGAKIQSLEWDLSTISAGDYTVEFNIKSAAYKEWKETEFIQGGAFSDGVAPVAAYKDALIAEIESTLSDILIKKRMDERNDLTQSLRRKSTRRVNAEIANDVQKVQVADIIFAYDNANLIKLLKKRGTAIGHLKFDEMRKVEKEIDELINTEFDKLTEPVSAFIIFEDEDGVIVALQESRENKDAKIMGQNMNFTAATEPTNIIWENRHITKVQMYLRLTIVTIISGILLAVSFYVIFLTQVQAIDANSTFPPTTDCTAVNENYGSQLQYYATYEYQEYEHNPKAYLAGAFQCFCQNQTDTYGLIDIRTKMYPVNLDRTEEAPMCGTYIEVVTIAYLLYNSLCYVITGINYVLRVIVIMLIQWVGFPTQTEELSWITTGVFYTQFFNTAFLLLMVNADLSEQPVNFGATSGSIGDFNMNWFQSTGNSLIATILFIAYWPILEFFMYWGLRILFRCLDRGICNFDKYTTKKTSLLQYCQLYAGPQYFMHYKYSAILNVCFCTFMYGFGMPILFPIALVTFIILYFVEKSMLYYSYQLPPMYDERLNDDVLGKLQWAPLFFFIFGYWMLSSNQLIGNELYPISDVNSTPLSGHVMGEVFDSSGWNLPAWPYLLFFWLLLVHLTVGKWIYECIYKCFPQLKIGDVELDEEIDNYYKALDDESRKWSIKEEENSRQVIGMKCMPDQAFERLKVAISSDSTLKGVHTYDLLANPLYADQFQYFSASLDDREMYIIDDDEDEGNDNAQSDLVRVALNLGYMTEANAIKFKFSKEDFRISAQAMGGTGSALNQADQPQLNSMI